MRRGLNVQPVPQSASKDFLARSGIGSFWSDDCPAPCQLRHDPAQARTARLAACDLTLQAVIACTASRLDPLLTGDRKCARRAGFSKFISGVLGARASPRVILGGGLMATAVVNIGFGFGASYVWFLCFWALNGLLQVPRRTVCGVERSTHCHRAQWTAVTLAAQNLSRLRAYRRRQQHDSIMSLASLLRP